MSAEALSRSLGLLPESMIQEALEAKALARSPRKGGWLRAAACLALVTAMLFGTWFSWSGNEIVTAPGILTVKAYGLSEDNTLVEYELEEGVQTADFKWSIGMNVYPGLPIEFVLEPDETLILNITVNHGDLINWSSLTNWKIERQGQQYAMHYHETADSRFIYWENLDPDTWDLIAPQEPIYLDVVISQEGHITGYAVLEIIPISDDNGLLYRAELLKSAAFPKIAGKYQNVTEENVQEQIRLVKESE